MSQSSDRLEPSSGTDRAPRTSRASSDGSTADSRSTEPILTATGLTKTYGDGDDAVEAVDGIDLEVERGTVVGLLGPNGAGKTTTIKLFLGLIIPDAGTVRVDGTDPVDDPRASYRSVSAMLEGARNSYWRLTVRENLRFFARLADRPADAGRIDALIEQVGLTAKADTTVNELSRGMKQQVSLACTLIRDTPIAFLDEPTLGLDVESSLELRRQLRDLVERESRTVVLSSHDMDVIEDVCDRVIIMNDGRIVADGTVDELVDVFQTRSYRFTLEAPVPDAAKRTLAERFGVGEWTERGPERSFDVALQDDAFYDLVAVLERTNCTFLGVETVEPDLADVFLEVTGDGAATDDIGSRQRRTLEEGGTERPEESDGEPRVEHGENR
ncbi:ABC transporter ATP-binding protein [Natronosalvus halobius]|uniref:ABC transporter ATP-binding protein n=1 Tax=Natronosalvus halobius TaxID=2953746 RepID=UPI00209DFE85|nr:ABC transporter ATP-binding protein [Natronosalvus halobius]USZ72980.1 ABC transporter ATP-binding protein [Natronosalvus halobius]